MDMPIKIFSFSALLFGIWIQPVTGQNLHLNEILSSNETTLADENGDFEDWIEIHNSGGEEVVLTHADGTLLDQSPERELEEDISLGRQPDGTGE